MNRKADPMYYSYVILAVLLILGDQLTKLAAPSPSSPTSST